MLPTCFPQLPIPAPLQNLAFASRIGSRRVAHQPGDSVAELSGGTGRQCRGAVGRHWGQCSRAVRHWGSSRGPDHRAHLHWWLTCNNYSNRIQSFTQCLQPQQPRPMTSRNAPRGRWCSSTLDGSWRMGSPVVGRLTNVVVPFNSWFFPAQFGPMSKRGQELHLREVHCGAMLWEKGRGYDAWYGRLVMPCVCMLVGCLKGP